ncbi:hypothetical protein JCM8208_001229 [Rhodotorula glutinis]
MLLLPPALLVLLAALDCARPIHALQIPLDPTSSSHRRRDVGRGEYRMMPTYSPYEGGVEAPELRMPTGFSRNVPERRIHSHNDYWRDVPVYTALSHGVLSVEADVWLNSKDDTLYVSHSVAALTRARTFQRLYISQLVDVVARANVHDRESKFFEGVDYYSQENEREPRRPWTSFYEGNMTPIRLLVDLKTRGNETYHAVVRELAPLRERGWLSRWNGTHVVPGPIQVLLTGNGINADVRAQVASARDRDVFLDAPLLKLDETWIGVDGVKYGWNSSLAPMASASFSSATSWTGRRAIDPALEGAPLAALFSSTQARGFETRLWSSPRWPTHVRDRVWQTLYNLGTDWLDVDDIEAAAAF